MARFAGQLALAVLAAMVVYGFAQGAGVKWENVTRLAHRPGGVGVSCLVLFGVCGLGLVRMWLPDTLRRYELLWIMPVGACASALGLTALGFMGVPFWTSLRVLMAAAALLGLYTLAKRPPAGGWLSLVRRPGHPGAARHRGAIAWASYLAILIAVVAIIPMARLSYPTVLGDGSDAHLAAGTANFLEHHYPTSVHPEEPVDLVPLVWRSKTPIYYAFAGVTSVSGLDSFEVLAALQAVMVALAALGFFLVARELLGARTGVALTAMTIVGLDRMVLHTAMHPYMNQTWGFFAMPYAIVLAWVLTRDGGAQRTRGGLVLLALMLAVEAFAYPLALPLPVLALAVFAWQDRRARRQAGQPVAPIRLGGLYRGRRSLLWLVPLAAVLAVPLRGVIEKAGAGAIVVLDFTHSLGTWAGDVPGYFPEHEFLSLSSTPILLVVSPLLLLAIGLALRHAPRSVRWGLGSLLVFGVAAVVLFRLRRFGYYFHFKILAFLGPLAVVMIAVGLSRIRRVGIALLVLYALNAQAGATDELTNTHNQLSDLIVQLRPANAKLPPGSSIRLDMNPGLQIWTAYMLAPHRLCSQRPVLNTSYPHVPISRKADFILANHGMRQPFDAQGGPIAYLGQFRLYREKPDVPGPDRCSQRMVQTVNDIAAS